MGSEIYGKSVPQIIADEQARLEERNGCLNLVHSIRNGLGLQKPMGRRAVAIESALVAQTLKIHDEWPSD